VNFIKGYYSIVQYCPDPSRLETVNLGVALFCPESGFLKVRFGRRKTRVDQLFGKQDWEFVEKQKAAIESRLLRADESFPDLEAFETYISRRANSLKLTAPRSVKVENPELELVNLEKRLVADGSKSAPRAATVARELSDIFRREHVDDLLQRNVIVRPPALPKALRVPFAFQNGKLNLIEAIQFDGQSPSAVFREASVHSVEGRFISQYRDPRLGELGLVVVAKFSEAQDEERLMAQRVFEEHRVPMYAFGGRALAEGGLEPLITQIRMNAHA